MSVQKTVYHFSSDATHFTTDIAAGARDNESINMHEDLRNAGINKLMITSVSIILDHNTAAMDLDVIFYANDQFEHATDIFSDRMIQMLRFEAADAVEHPDATDIYYYETQSDMNMPIDYVDEDLTGKIHVGLVNRSANLFDVAGASLDKIKISFAAEPVI